MSEFGPEDTSANKGPELVIGEVVFLEQIVEDRDPVSLDDLFEIVYISPKISKSSSGDY